MIEMEIQQADVTRLDVDAIANAANTQLKHGGGVAAAGLGGEVGAVEVGAEDGGAAGVLALEAAAQAEDVITAAPRPSRPAARCAATAWPQSEY